MPSRRLLLAAAMLLAEAHAQPAFEVATLKPAPPPAGNAININLGTVRNGRITFDNVTLSDLIKSAYGLVSDAQLVGPDWIRTDVRFNVVGQAPPDTPREQLQLMLRPLLAERLHLVLRQEQRTLPHLALVLAKGGPKLQPSKDTAPATQAPQVRGRMIHTQMPMALLATLLSRFERQTVVDLTGLKGPYEVKLEWTPDSLRPPTGDPGPPPEHPSLFAAVQEQLGLKLESRRGPLEVLVVVSAEKVPEGN